MKKFTLIALLTLIAASNFGQVYNVTKNGNVSNSGIPDNCVNCVINISPGVTLTINKDVYFTNVTINGGTLQLSNKKITFWGPGTFENVTVNATGNKAGITSSGPIAVKQSTFNFSNDATGIFWAPVTMEGSKMIFLDGANIESTSTFTMKNASHLIAGDGTKADDSFVKFNGGVLYLYDQSYVALLNNNNSYFNWNPYYHATSGQSFTTAFNNLNCGTVGTNPCSAPVVYGPATLNGSGVASNAILPVKLSAFEVRQSMNRVDITWTTGLESNASHFEIEKSTDGLRWTVAGKVHARGNSSAAVQYAFADYGTVVGSVSYRLKMVDLDTKFEYSVVKTVRGKDVATVSLYPNPAADQVTIKAGNSGSATVQLISQTGQLVKTATGKGSISISVRDCVAGQYFVRVIDSAGQVDMHKLLVSK